MSTSTELIGCVQHDCAKCKAQADAIEALEASQERNTKYTLALQDDALKLQTEVERLTTLAHGQHIELYNARLQLAAAQGQSHDIAVGVLYDFMGWLTTRGKKLVLSSTDSAAPAADAIRDFTKMRNVSSENPLIKTWHAAPIPQQTAPSVPEGWKHNCDALCVNDLALWIDQCPHCGKPRQEQPAAPQPKETK